MTREAPSSGTLAASATGPFQPRAASAASPFSLALSPSSAERHVPALPVQNSGGYEAVAAIVAGAAQNDDAPACGPVRAARCVRDGAAGRLHEIDSAHAAGDGSPVRLAHLGDGQQFEGLGNSLRAHCVIVCERAPIRKRSGTRTGAGGLCPTKPRCGR